MLMERGIVTLLVGLVAFSTMGEAAVSKAKAKAEFAAAMGKAVRETKQAQHEKERKTRLRKSLLSKATPVTASEKNKIRRLADDDDDAEDDWGEFNFDASLYSVKYSGCHRLPQYPDEEQQDEENNNNNNNGNDDGDWEETPSTFYTYKNLVTFRLCESESCSQSCDSNYGEYMISLADYMEAMVEYKEKVLEYYCDYCEKCMYFENYFYGHRNLDEEGDDAAEDDEAMDEAEEEAYMEYYANEDDDGSNHACKYYNECVNYGSVCEGGDDDDDDDYYQDGDLQELLECRELDNYYYHGSFAFAGLYCQDDRKTIGVGVFADQYCSQYIGDEVDFVEATRMNISESELSFFSDDSCIPCNENDQQYKVVGMEEADAGDGDEEMLLELCERIYESSAKCQMNLMDEYGYYGNLATSNREEAVCEFIDEVASQEYDDYGFLYSNKLTYKRDVYHYLPVMSECTLLQQVGLVVSFAACIIMGFRICCLKCYLAYYLRNQQPNLLPNDKGEFNHGSATDPNSDEYQEIKQSESQKFAKKDVISLKRFDSLDTKYNRALQRITELEKASRNYVAEIASSFDSKVKKGLSSSFDSKAKKSTSGDKEDGKNASDYVKQEEDSDEKDVKKSISVLEMFLNKIDPTYTQEKEEKAKKEAEEAAAATTPTGAQKPPLAPKKPSSKDAKPPLPPKS